MLSRGILFDASFSPPRCRGGRIRRAQGRSVELDCDAVMLQTVQEGIDEGLALKQLIPIGVDQI